MATLLSITNKVLKRLREDTVADLSDDYANLIASFVADIHQEVNEAAQWSALDHTVEVTVVDGTRVYSLDATNEKSLLLYDLCDVPQAWIFDDDTDQYGVRMIQLAPEELERLYRQDTSMSNDTPYYFSLTMNSAFTGPQLTLWPTPSAARTIRLRFNTPEAELDPDVDSDTAIKLPERPIRLGALYLALNERGEEIGEPGGIAERRYMAALSAAAENEVRARERQGEYDWFRK